MLLMWSFSNGPGIAGVFHNQRGKSHAEQIFPGERVPYVPNDSCPHLNLPLTAGLSVADPVTCKCRFAGNLSFVVEKLLFRRLNNLSRQQEGQRRAFSFDIFANAGMKSRPRRTVPAKANESGQ